MEFLKLINTLGLACIVVGIVMSVLTSLIASIEGEGKIVEQQCNFRVFVKNMLIDILIITIGIGLINVS